MSDDTNANDQSSEQERKGIPLRWIFYVILGYAFLQTFYFWWSMRGE